MPWQQASPAMGMLLIPAFHAPGFLHVVYCGFPAMFARCSVTLFAGLFSPLPAAAVFGNLGDFPI